jgi:hypothetical protein
MYQITLATVKGADPVLTCSGCSEHMGCLKDFEIDLSRAPYLNGPTFNKKELDLYQGKVKPMAHLIEKHSNSLPKLSRYL